MATIEKRKLSRKKNIEGLIAEQITKAFPAILPLAINHNLGWHIPICLSSFSGVIQIIWYQIITFTKVRAIHLLSGGRAKQENLWLLVSSILSDSEVIVPCLRVQFINNFLSFKKHYILIDYLTFFTTFKLKVFLGRENFGFLLACKEQWDRTAYD